MKSFNLSEVTVNRHRKWSDQTFGPRSERGPVGTLKHLAKEVQETLAEPHDVEEYADMMFLLMDSLHRAGFDDYDLRLAMDHKMDVLESRVYLPGAKDEPSEHLREIA